MRQKLNRLEALNVQLTRFISYKLWWETEWFITRCKNAGLGPLEHYVNINYPEQRVVCFDKKILYLNLDKNTITKHKSFIKDIKTYFQVFQCVTEYNKLTLLESETKIFQPGNNEPPKNILEELDELGITTSINP
jgi:hypothetical protein